ncbi:uncharacterized protein J4E84_003129 [Alternaria hordeiaustralica]|uniref:uncharacterized protein n=1 Tax=Alternaria hordeiaustralica TaxID=1187925 RepID=UPI0020C31BFF|nr:uncharacterized protein J4E84_003129 [Alternaria hordeiaustralica]KAI4692161.1 hypothetical protein J4E84_003129 [Alternaria hordeiaustralica]
MPKESLSAREIEVLALAWQCVDPQPKVDMVKLAALTGYTPGSASVTFGNIKRKLKNMAAGASEDSPATPAAKSRSGGRARATATSTPKKRGATAAPTSASKRSKKGAAARETTSSASDGNNDDDDDDDFGLNGPKVKKEEPAFDDGFDLVEEDVSSRDASMSYGFLDGIETFGGGGAAKGSGRNASNGYRTVQLEEDE